jgi:asparagine synthetase B (glutamine-hydrolysing)
MKVVTDRQSARELAGRAEPLLYTHVPAGPLRGTGPQVRAGYLIGRRYHGAFDDDDGSFVSVDKADHGTTVIDRDSYGSIPLFYSTTRPFVSTDIRVLLEIEKPEFDWQALAEYLSTSYLTGGKTLYAHLRFLMPNETIVIKDATLTTHEKNVFPEPAAMSEQDVVRLLNEAVDRSIEDLLQRKPKTVMLNLSGGADSTLLLAKMRQRDPDKDITTTTFFHEDWRDDLNDWKYAEEAAARFGSRHRLVKINNVSFCQAHNELMDRAQNVFHTYAAAFYSQNQVAADLGLEVPIVNGSGPDESIIGSEKIPISELLSLRALEREKWIDYLINHVDYIKISEAKTAEFLRCAGEGFVRTRRAIAEGLMSAANFVEFQRRYHAITVLQDHIQELSAVAQALGREILFPYLTNDIFRIVFSAPFELLNSEGVYKSVVKTILREFMPECFVHRRKIGFQSPSRPYFKSKIGLGAELSRLLSNAGSSVLNMGPIRSGVRQRLEADLDLTRRYDFLEWTAYNILLLEEFRSGRA